MEVLSAAPDVIGIEGNVTISNTTAFSNAVNGFMLTPMGSVSVTNVSAVQNGADGVLFTPFFDSTVAAAQVLDENRDPPCRQSSSRTRSSSATAWMASPSVQITAGFTHRLLNAYVRPIPPTRDARKSPVVTAAAPVMPIEPSVPDVSGNINCANQQSGLFATQPMSQSYDAMGNWVGCGKRTAPCGQERRGNRQPGGRRHERGRHRRGELHPLDLRRSRPARQSARHQYAQPGDLPVHRASNTYFLGQGVGNLNDPPPFTISTPNGLLQVGGATGTNLAAYIGSDKKLTATFTPTPRARPHRLGDRTVWAARLGSDGRSGAQDRSHQDRGHRRRRLRHHESIEVQQGTPVYYCVTVKNIGVVPLTYHLVSDPLLGVTIR